MQNQNSRAASSLRNTFRSLTSAAVLSVAFLTSGVAQAATWSSSNVQLLKGNSYELGDSSRTIFTYENALGFDYGDSFFFIDVTEPFDSGTSFYSEFSPRFSLSKMTGSDMSSGAIKDVMIATTLEMGDGVRGTLIGVGLPLKLDGFAFADVNFYLRKSERDFAAVQTDTGMQLTLVWKRPFSIGSTQWSFEGFFDYAFGEDSGSAPKKNNIITAPRLLMNLGSVEVGIEYQIWKNKFGVDGVDENVAQVMAKWVF